MLERTPQQNSQNANEKTLQRMRWFILIIIAAGFLGSIAASIIMKSPLPLSIGLLLRPIITHFFPKDPKPK
jgi:hypothetical protein